MNPSELRRKLRLHRLQEVELPDGTIVFAPWEFRNSIMGGRHTEEMGGNLSFQEFMFLPLTARDYIEAQRVTNMLQSRAIQIIQDSEGLNFVGIGLEGGIVASYAKQAGDILPEERALRVAVQAIEQCGFVPDRDVVLALDPAASELSNAYREKTGEKDSVGQYLFWRAEDPKVMTTDEMVELYIGWVKKYPDRVAGRPLRRGRLRGLEETDEGAGRRDPDHRRRPGHHQGFHHPPLRRRGADQHRADQSQPDRHA